jgi:hypothetical protein
MDANARVCLGSRALELNRSYVVTRIVLMLSQGDAHEEDFGRGINFIFVD